ncbi:hypothetical protein LPY66_11490 [Dehalobacter sp. DCM]|uniref:hypothetical protein n=1 Tax=Dehalobacter sp. DCM TaxID=2907827 RepID=UPI003081BE7B|nr:hypothetical protein LPY66_11490 [Dehalobacter sp. DCM]
MDFENQLLIYAPTPSKIECTHIYYPIMAANHAGEKFFTIRLARTILKAPLLPDESDYEEKITYPI